MSDLLDEIIDRLPPSTINMILQFDRDYHNHSLKLNNLLRETQQTKINSLKKDLERKTSELESRTVENKKLLMKIKSDLENMPVLKSSEGNQHNIKNYLKIIEELENELRRLTRHFGNLNVVELYNDEENLYKEILECKKKIVEAKKKYECFKGFPPNIEQAKKVLAKLKEDIRNSKEIKESKLM